jgi:hypothetical protein
MTKCKLQYSVGILFLITALVAVVSSIGLNGSTVLVRNLSRSTINQVCVDVSGRTYFLGSIPPNATLTTRVRPKSESDITVRYDDKSGVKHSSVVDCYLEPRGKAVEVYVTIDDDNLTYELFE